MKPIEVDLGEITKQIKALYGETVSEDVIEKEVMREVIYRAADQLLMAKELVVIKQFDDLLAKWAYPKDLQASYPVAEGALAEYAGPLEWKEFTMELKKAQIRFMITDEAKIRQLGKYQLDFTQRKAAEALAKLKEDNIIERLVAGAHHSFAASAAWTSASASQITKDIADAFEYIIKNGYISMADLKSAKVVVPPEVWGEITAIQEINNIKQSIKDYVKSHWGVDIQFTTSSKLSDNALVLVPSELTAIHGVLKPGKIPLSEKRRVHGRGDEFIISQYFETVVVPETGRIVKITDVY